MTTQQDASAVIANPETTVFLQAAAQGRLLVPKCTACGRFHWYPRRICPHCASTAVEMQEAEGSGEVYSYSIMRRAKVPYVIAYVALVEGTTMMTNIVDCDLDDIRVGMKVRLVFKPSPQGYPLPMFTKA